MAKSPSSHKQVFIYIVVLAIGVAVGALIPRGGTGPSGDQPGGEPCVTSASVATEPAAELLGSPVFRDAGTIFSSKDGLILVRWLPVNGAATYRVRVWNESGLEVKNFLTSKTFTFLKNLAVDPAQKETPYHVVVTPLDASSTHGKDSERKMVAMLPLRNLDPPTIKSIQTEKEEDPKD